MYFWYIECLRSGQNFRAPPDAADGPGCGAMALVSPSCWPALLVLLLVPPATAAAEDDLLRQAAAAAESRNSSAAPETNASYQFPSCGKDADCPGALQCFGGTCGCPLARPVLVLLGHVSGKNALGPLCESVRRLAESCVWTEQCSASDPGLACKSGSCQCITRSTPWGGVCGTRGILRKLLIWAACFAVIALAIAGLMFCIAQSQSRTKSTCFSESCLISPSEGSVLPNPAAQRLLFSRRKDQGPMEAKRCVGCCRGCSSTGHHSGGRIASAAGRAGPLPRGFLSCHGLQQPLDDPRGDLGRSSCSIAAEGPAESWPPVPLLERSEPSLELQVISLDTLSAPAASVHSLRRASAPALVATPAATADTDASMAALPQPLGRSEGGEPGAAVYAAARHTPDDAVHEWASKLGEQLANESYGFTLDISHSSLPAVLPTEAKSVDSEHRRANRQSRLRKNISESLRRELAEAWRCSGGLPSAQLLLQPPAFLMTGVNTPVTEVSPGSD